MTTAGPSHEVTLQRFKLLHLVQQVAKEDVAELVRTVGIDALTYRGSGIRGVQGDTLPQPRRDSEYVERREHHRHVFRDFAPATATAATRRPMRGRHEPSPVHALPRDGGRALYYSYDDEPYRHPRPHRAEPLLHRESPRDDRQHLVSSPEPQQSHHARVDEVRPITRPPRRREDHPSARHSEQQPSVISGPKVTFARPFEPVSSSESPSPPQLNATGPPTPVPSDIIALAAQMLARSSSRSSQRTSTQVTPTKKPLRMTPVSDGRRDTDTTPLPVGGRRTTTAAASMEDAAVEATVTLLSTATNTPPPARKMIQTKSTAVATEPPPPLNDDVTAKNQAPPPTLDLGTAPALHTDTRLEGKASYQVAHREYATGIGAVQTQPKWVLEALSVLDNVVQEQADIDVRRQRMTTRDMSGSGLVAKVGDHHRPSQQWIDNTTKVAVDDDTLAALAIGRAARSVDRMLVDESNAEGIRLARHEDERPDMPKPSSRNRSAGQLPQAVVEQLLKFRADEVECIRYNETLWNTSNVSQYVFADRLTSSLLADLMDEVLDEVSSVLDDYVDGLAEHELQ
jgi:hypothetical protein